MRRFGYAMMSLVLLAVPACGGADSAERIVSVDYSHDEFASFMIANFPKEVTVNPGDAVVFKQVWTGVPHTVTGGTLVNKMMDDAKFLIPFFESFDALEASGAKIPDPELEPEKLLSDLLGAVEDMEDSPERTQFLDAYDGLVESGSKLPPRDDPGDMTLGEVGRIIEKESEAVFDAPGLPWAIDENEDGSFVAQNAGQPCYLEKGTPPKKADKACDEEDQRQPVFDGTAAYYNSGVIPYEGPQGNTFRVKMADDIETGDYYFYCAVHGPSQNTKVSVTTGEAPPQEDVSRQARAEVDTFADPMLETFRDAEDGEVEIEGEKVRGPFAGLSPPAHGSINEFVPRTIRADVGEEVTWKLMGAEHTVSFDVPEYFPVIRFAKNGEVSLNPKLEPPAGGSPEVPKTEGPPGAGPPGVVKVDGGTYDGSGFFSSGLFGAQPYAEYTLRFSKPGTYKYACLLHPPMVGTVEVT